jgi:methylphosphotriester-DNA--protein-cysteine methyltransferase
MKAENRVFFSSEEEAITCGYRPCAHCLPEKYKRWKAKNGLPEEN